MLSAQTRLIAPVAIADVDLEEPRELALDARYRSVLVLVRRAGEPLGLIAMPCDERAVGFEALAAEAARQLDGRVTGRISPPPLPVGTRPPALSVVVTTCALPKRAIRCARSILACETSPLEVIVVENRPGRVATAELIGMHFAGDERVRCIEEPRAGLSTARNAGLWNARGDVVAFTDDDVIADGDWTGAIATAFARTPEAVCVTGPILPLELEDDGQLMFEQLGRFGKVFERRRFTLADPPAGDLLFPYAAGRFGSGANISLRADAARELRGFDEQLGAGTYAKGGEDLDLFVRVLHMGGAIVYEPRAIIRHQHSGTPDQLRHHAVDYGIGLTAFLTKQLLFGADRLGLLRRVAAGARYAFDPASEKNMAKGERYPAALRRLEWLGMALGPVAYARSRFTPARRASR